MLSSAPANWYATLSSGIHVSSPAGPSRRTTAKELLRSGSWVTWSSWPASILSSPEGDAAWWKNGWWPASDSAQGPWLKTKVPFSINSLVAWRTIILLWTIMHCTWLAFSNILQFTASYTWTHWLNCKASHHSPLSILEEWYDPYMCWI